MRAALRAQPGGVVVVVGRGHGMRLTLRPALERHFGVTPHANPGRVVVTAETPLRRSKES